MCAHINCERWWRFAGLESGHRLKKEENLEQKTSLRLVYTQYSLEFNIHTILLCDTVAVSPTLCCFRSLPEQHLLQQPVHLGLTQQLCKVKSLHHLPGHTLQGRQDQQELPEPSPPLTGCFFEQQLGLETQMSNHLRTLQTWTLCEAKVRGHILKRRGYSV